MPDKEIIIKIVFAFVLSVVVSFAATPLVKRMAYKVGAIDVPKDDRRMHKVPIPRLGGLAIFIAFLFSTLLFYGQIDTKIQGVLLGLIMIVVLGVMDDIITLPALPKFLVQIAAAGVAVYHECRIEAIGDIQLSQWVSIPVSIIWIVAITNAVNFIDGLDGLAVGVSAISTACMLVIAIISAVKPDDWRVCIILAALLGSCLGFIPYNFNPAKIFMGDTGATFLGFVLACLSITGLFKTYTAISFAVPFLVLGVPIFDICFAFLRRILKGQNPMKSDRGHVHHKLIDMGFNQKQAVAISYTLTAILGIAAVLLATTTELRALILIGAILIVAVFGVQIVFRKPEHKSEGKKHEED